MVTHSILARRSQPSGSRISALWVKTPVAIWWLSPVRDIGD